MINSPKSLMACGHISSALFQDEDGNRLPVCLSCSEIDERKILAKQKVELKSRFARCGGACHEIVPSNPNLPFFEYRPDREYDLHYNGCNTSGWD